MPIFDCKLPAIMKYIHLAICCLLLCVSASAQRTKVDSIVYEGATLHDQGDYNGAIKKYKEALAIDKNSSNANCEMANTLVEAKRYEEAIGYADKVIELKNGNEELAYAVKGTSYDMLGKYEEAVEAYSSGLKRFPDNYLLHYNLAYTHFMGNHYTLAEQEAIAALKLKHNHANGHMILAECAKRNGEKSKALLSLYYYLLLRADSKDAPNALKMIEEQMTAGVTRESDTQINITLTMDAGADSSFRTADVLLAATAALSLSAEHKNEDTLDRFIDNTSNFFSTLGKLRVEYGYRNNYWWDEYVPFFYEMYTSEQTKLFCYYIHLSKNDARIKNWLVDHEKDLTDFSRWYNNYYKQ